MSTACLAALYGTQLLSHRILCNTVMVPGRSPLPRPMFFIIIHICTGTTTTWMNMTYTSSQVAQSLLSWALRPRHPEEPQLSLDSLIKQLVSTVGLVSWGLHTYVVPQCVLLLPSISNAFDSLLVPRVLSVHANYTLVSLGLPLQITEQDPQSSSLSAPFYQKCVIFICIMLAVGLQLFLMGTGLGTPIMNMQQNIIRVVCTE